MSFTHLSRPTFRHTEDPTARRNYDCALRRLLRLPCHICAWILRAGKAALASQIAAIAAALVVVGCNTVPSSSDYGPTAKFSAYSTFAVMERERGQGEDDTVILQTEKALKLRLQSKGYELVSSPDRADFVFDFTLGSAGRTDISSYQPVIEVLSWFPPGHMQ